jgi:hypothetical protein
MSQCGSAHQYMSNLVGGVNHQVDGAVGGMLAQIAPKQFGGKRRRSRRVMTRRTSRRHKKRLHRKKSRKLTRKRK